MRFCYKNHGFSVVYFALFLMITSSVAVMYLAQKVRINVHHQEIAQQVYQSEVAARVGIDRTLEYLNGTTDVDGTELPTIEYIKNNPSITLRNDIEEGSYSVDFDVELNGSELKSLKIIAVGCPSGVESSNCSENIRYSRTEELLLASSTQLELPVPPSASITSASAKFAISGRVMIKNDITQRSLTLPPSQDSNMRFVNESNVAQGMICIQNQCPSAPTIINPSSTTTETYTFLQDEANPGSDPLTFPIENSNFSRTVVDGADVNGNIDTLNDRNAYNDRIFKEMFGLEWNDVVTASSVVRQTPTSPVNWTDTLGNIKSDPGYRFTKTSIDDNDHFAGKILYLDSDIPSDANNAFATFAIGEDGGTAPITLGTPEDPVILIVNAPQLLISQPTVVYGYLYARGVVFINATVNVTGGMYFGNSWFVSPDNYSLVVAGSTNWDDKTTIDYAKYTNIQALKDIAGVDEVSVTAVKHNSWSMK